MAPVARNDRHQVSTESADARTPNATRTTGRSTHRLRRTGLAAAATAGSVAAVLALLLIPLGAAHSVGIIAAGAVPAGDGQLRSVDANFSGNITFTSVSVVNNVTNLTATTYRSLVGDMSGVLLAYEWGSVQPNGSMWVRGIGTFVGTILGEDPGVVDLVWFATGIYGGALHGTIHVSQGHGGLAGIHGSGTASARFTGATTFDGSYDLALAVP
ncbi:MAG: hypothetical protein L3K15_08330 [Thermoplasmata archaeon]|nr:hypothetical protein [Thermoplasmata archaeon]